MFNVFREGLTMLNETHRPENLLDELLTPKELAARLKCSVRTAYREQREGRIPGRLVRGRLRFWWPDVVRALPPAPVAPMPRRAAHEPVDLVC
jgi:hypothetical protein